MAMIFDASIAAEPYGTIWEDAIVDPFSAARWAGKLTIRPFSPHLLCDIYMIRNRAQVSSMLQQAFEREFRIALEENMSEGVHLF